MNSNEPDITRAQLAVGNPEVTYEGRDLSPWAVVLFLVFLAVGGIVITVGMWGVYKFVAGDRFQARPGPAQVQAESQAIVKQFPEPRLQADPTGDMDRFKAKEDAILNSYGWVDPPNGRIHIPIERAMDEVVTTGLPVRPSNETPQMDAEKR